VLAQGGEVRHPGARPGPHARLSPGPYRTGVVLIGLRQGISAARRHAIERAASAAAAGRLGPPIRAARAQRAAHHPLVTPLLLRVPRQGVLAAVHRLRGEPGVAYAEPDYLMRADATPNDPSFPLQWAPSLGDPEREREPERR